MDFGGSNGWNESVFGWHTVSKIQCPSKTCSKFVSDKNKDPFSWRGNLSQETWHGSRLLTIDTLECLDEGQTRHFLSRPPK
jgi:hypothetical protein